MSDSRRAGYFFGLIAYTWWGLVPLYFINVKHVLAVEILAHRIVWSVGIMAVVLTLSGGWPEFRRVLQSRRLVLTMLLSGCLLAVNWLLYIKATVSDRVSEASLGYFMMPLVNTFLGTLFLKEKLRPAHYPALALVAIGVLIPVVAKSTVPILAIALAVSFGLYGLVKKMAPVDSLTGLSVETLLLAVPSLGFILYQALQGEGHFGTDWPISTLLAFGGVITVVPLLTFNLSIRRLPLLAVSFIQFLSPTVQLVLSVTVLHETVGDEKWAALGCVWLAVAIFIGDAALRHVRTTRAEDRVMTSESDAVGAMELPTGAER